MPSLDSPALTLGALFIAGNSARGRQFTGGESGKGMLAGGFAASSAEYAADRARNFAGVGESAVSDELAQALVGAGMSRFGDPIPQNNAMARGIMYNVAAQSFQSAGFSLGQLMNGSTGGNGGSNGGTAQPTPSRSTGATSGGATKVY